jgi:hypothetical protein
MADHAVCFGCTDCRSEALSEDAGLNDLLCIIKKGKLLRYCVINTVLKLLSAIILLICLQAPAHAARWNPDAVPNDVTSFLLGFVGGIAIHELGHVTVATAKGYKTHNDGLSLVYSPEFSSHRDRLRISTAGFQTQWLTTETAFYYRAKAPDLTLGLITSHLAITAAYLAVLKNHPRSDTFGASQASGLSTDQIILIATVPALLDGWRLFDSEVPSWVAPLSIAYKAGCLTAIWTY